MSTNNTRLNDGTPEPMSRRSFLSAAGVGGLALLGSITVPARASGNANSPRFALVEYRLNATYPLHSGSNRIGRHAHNDIVFADNCISRRHCVLWVLDDGGCELHDTHSRNGTFVNGEPVTTPRWLTIGDAIRICDRLLVLVDQTALPPLLEPGRPVPGSLEWAEENGYLDTAYLSDWL